MDFLLHQSFLFLSIGGLLFLPGFLVLRALFGKKDTPLTPLENFITAFALSVGIIDFLMILLGKNHIPLIPSAITYALSLFLIAIFIVRRIIPFKKDTSQTTSPEREHFRFTRAESGLFLLLLFLTLFTKSLYLSDAAFPSSTDLGHHLYWSKVIAETGSLPRYAKQDIVIEQETIDHEGSIGIETRERISQPEPIADFIIGEHLPFAAIAIFSGITFLSAFPVIILFLVNMLSLLASFALALRLGEDMRSIWKRFSPQHFGLLVLFFQGPLYTLASPQAKFVSGGVIGNTFGNFFIPVILLFFFRSIREKNPLFMGVAFLLTFTLAYTHHLSMLILLFILAGSMLPIVLFHFRSVWTLLSEWMNMLRHPFPLGIAIACILFFFIVAMPTYIETHAVGTAIGTPTKSTRIGLTFAEILSAGGEARAAIGLVGFVLLAFLARSIPKTAGLLLGWTGILLIMSMRPSLVFLDIPSNRIGSYLIFPFTFLAAISILLMPILFKKFREKSDTSLPFAVIASFCIVIFAYSIASGSADNGGTLLSAPKADPAVQTFAAARFLSERIRPEDIVLKDHNYLSADSFMKLFFMRDYGFPLSRGYFKRYENPGHEQCSLIMITSPNTQDGERCFAETGTDIVVVNPLFDRAQFEKSPRWSRIYSSPLIHAYSL